MELRERSGFPFKLTDSFRAIQTLDIEDPELAGGCGCGLRGVKRNIGIHSQCDCMDTIYQVREARREVLWDYFCGDLRRVP